MKAPHVALELILGEIRLRRERQVEHHRWSREHDDTHAHGELATAAIPYIQAANMTEFGLTREELQVFWPWEGEFRLTDDRRENLLNAAALLVAELERMDRL